MLTPRAFASSTVLRMMSASAAWKPQAMLTEVASSIMAASLPISQAPNPSPRSQLRSMVFIWMSSFWGGDLLSVRCQHIRAGCNLPGDGVDGAHRAAGDISILQRLNVEIKALNGAQTVGQGAQRLPIFPRLCLRFRHGDGLEVKAGRCRNLREPAEIG